MITLEAARVALRQIEVLKRRPMQKRADYQGIPVRIDRPKGFVQHGKDESGAAWERTYKLDYGYLPHTTGGDDEELDVYLGPDSGAKNAHWIVQNKADGSFDEFKLMLGFENRAAAKAGWLAHTPEKYFGGLITTRLSVVKALMGVHPSMPGSKRNEPPPTADEEAEKSQPEFSDRVMNWLADQGLLMEQPAAADAIWAAASDITKTFDQSIFDQKMEAFELSSLYGAEDGECTNVIIKRVFGVDVKEDDRSTPPEIKMEIIKAREDDDHFVYGVVLEPDTVDAQADTYDEDAVRKAAHFYMAHFRNVGLQHKTFVNYGSRVVESFIAPCDFQVGSRTVKKGSWVAGMSVSDDEIWKKIVSGELTGFSIGGTASVEQLRS